MSGYRSFGPEPQFVAPLAEINIFAGQNNSGKSNVLRLISVLENVRKPLDPILDYHKGKRFSKPTIYLPLDASTKSIATALPEINAQAYGTEPYKELNKFIEQFQLQKADASWFGYDLLNQQKIVTPKKSSHL